RTRSSAPTRAPSAARATGLPVAKNLHTDRPELDGIRMTRETKVAAGAILARMIAVTHQILHLAQVRIQNRVAIQFSANARTLHRHLLVIPLSHRAQVTALRGSHTVSRTVELPRIEIRILCAFVVQHLQFAHSG